MTQTFCHLRNVECSCSPTECRAAPAKPIKAPVALPSTSTIFAFYVFLAVLTVIGFGTAHALKQDEVQYQQQARV